MPVRGSRPAAARPVISRVAIVARVRVLRCPRQDITSVRAPCCPPLHGAVRMVAAIPGTFDGLEMTDRHGCREAPPPAPSTAFPIVPARSGLRGPWPSTAPEPTCAVSERCDCRQRPGFPREPRGMRRPARGARPSRYAAREAEDLPNHINPRAAPTAPRPNSVVAGRALAVFGNLVAVPRRPHDTRGFHRCRRPSYAIAWTWNWLAEAIDTHRSTCVRVHRRASPNAVG